MDRTIAEILADIRKMTRNGAAPIDWSNPTASEKALLEMRVESIKRK
jgi:hypothetical protein